MTHSDPDSQSTSEATQIAERDLLGATLPGDDPRAIVTQAFAEMAAGEGAMAHRYAEILSAGNGHDDLLAVFEEHLRLFAPGAHAGPDVAARERVFYLAVAACDRDPSLAHELRDLFASSARCFEPVIAEYLAITGRRPRSGAALSDLPALVGTLLEGLILRMRSNPSMVLRDAALSMLRALEGWTEADPDAERDERSTSVEQRVRGIDQQLTLLDPTSPEALALLLELLSLVPQSTIAFWRARHRATPLLALPGVRSTPLGRQVWLRATETIALADGDRERVEEAVRLRLESGEPIDDEPGGHLRFAWLLLRLDRFSAAARTLHAVRPDPRLTAADRTIVDAFSAYGLAATGPARAAIDLGLRAAAGEGFGAHIGAAVAVRALTRLGDLDRAQAVADAAPPVSTPASVGTTMFLIARGTLEAARGHPTRALEDLLDAREGLRRVGNRNPAGWPWLEPLVDALIQLDQRQKAQAVLEEARGDVLRWGTPLVVAEWQRARARLLTGAEADAAITAAVAVLERSEARHELVVTRQLLRPDRAGDPPRFTHRRAASVGPPLPVSSALDTLTPRVREVALLVAEGLRDHEIAERLTLSTRTVNRHVAAALKATGARNRVDLALLVRSTPDQQS